MEEASSGNEATFSENSLHGRDSLYFTSSSFTGNLSKLSSGAQQHTVFVVKRASSLSDSTSFSMGDNGVSGTSFILQQHLLETIDTHLLDLT